MTALLGLALWLFVPSSTASPAPACLQAAQDTSTELLAGLDALTPEQRKAKLVEFETLAHARARAKAAGGWKVVKDERFCLLTRGDDKNAARIADQAGAVLQWCDRNLPWYAPGAYVRRPVLLIYKDAESMYAARRPDPAGESGKDAPVTDRHLYVGATTIEIPTYDSKGGIEGAGGGRLNEDLVQYWLQEHDRTTCFALPGWLTGGLEEVARTMSFKHGKLSVTVDDHERDGIHALLRVEKSTSVRDLLRKVRVADEEEDYELRYGRAGLSATLIRLLTSGPAAKNPRFKDVLPNYFAGVAEAARGMRDEIAQAARRGAKGAPDSPPPKTEEEEIECFRRVRKAWQDAEQRVLDAAFEKAFRGWTDTDWKALQDAYDRAIEAL